MALLDIEHLSFTYPACETPTLRDVSVSIERGEFAVLCGATGSGKSTFLRMLKRALTPLGTQSGEIRFDGTPLPDLSERDAAAKIGFVQQRPEQQIVTDKVWHEMAFGLENLGLPQPEMARRIAETASYFGIGDWYRRDTAGLSGGQKQLLNLAGVLVMQPELLILDEPTAQLDPIAASEFIAALRRLNEDFGLTILMAEHRTEEAVPLCDRLLVMEHGSLIANGSPREVIADLRENRDFLCGMPAAARIGAALGADECPLTVREGKAYLRGFANTVRTLPEDDLSSENPPALELKDIWFRYERGSADVLRGMELTVRTGEIFCLLGGNGSGKSTTLSVAAGLKRPYAGKISIFGKPLRSYKNGSLYRECLALLPQDVQTLFLADSVREELKQCGAEHPPFDMTSLLDRHPYDLSGGEQQMAALAKVLAGKPKLLLLDEPTKGMDAAMKSRMTEILRDLKAGGMTIVVVTHDVEFAALCADRCAMCFDGSIASVGTPREFFGGNHFYTTAASRITRGYFDQTVTVGQAVSLCRQNGRREDAPCS